MAQTKYTFSIADDFPNQKVDLGKLTQEIGDSEIVTGLSFIDSDNINCYVNFKEELTISDSTSLTYIVNDHDGVAIIVPPAPTTPDHVPIVRSDSRPLGKETYFTMVGDSTAIGDGKVLLWDFSNNDDEFDHPDWIPTGFKAKKIQIEFTCPVWLKDGTIYFYDAPWGCYISMFVSVPANSYYPNSAGSIPASALGLSGNDMYAYTDQDLPYQSYIRKHHMHGSCPMGDELNAEGAALNPVPVGWKLCGLVITPDSDVVSKGFAGLEMYRCHTMLLPGQTLESIHS